MCSGLDEHIMKAAEKAASTEAAWRQKHLPVKINGETYWLSLEIPADIQTVLDVLPKKDDSESVQRPHQIKARLSDDELDTYEILLAASGLSQTDYIRGMVLHGQVNVTQTSLVDAQALDILTKLSADLGKTAGMIRQTIIVNKEFSVLTPESKDQLEYQVRKLRQLQAYIQRLAEEIHGHL